MYAFLFLNFALLGATLCSAQKGGYGTISTGSGTGIGSGSQSQVQAQNIREPTFHYSPQYGPQLQIPYSSSSAHQQQEQAQEDPNMTLNPSYNNQIQFDNSLGGSEPSGYGRRPFSIGGSTGGSQGQGMFGHHHHHQGGYPQVPMSPNIPHHHQPPRDMTFNNYHPMRPGWPGGAPEAGSLENSYGVPPPPHNQGHHGSMPVMGSRPPWDGNYVGAIPPVHNQHQQPPVGQQHYYDYGRDERGRSPGPGSRYEDPSSGSIVIEGTQEGYWHQPGFQNSNTHGQGYGRK